MKITIKIKPLKMLEATLEHSDDFNLKHTDFITPSEYVMNNVGKEIEAYVLTEEELNNLTTATQGDEEEADRLMALKYLTSCSLVFHTEDGDLVHYSWLSHINKEVTVSKISLKGNYVKVTKNYLIEKKNGVLHNKEDIKVCGNCGNYLDTEDRELCSECISSRYFNLHNYSYKPTPLFIGKQIGTHTKNNPIWYGLELEYGLLTQLKMAILLKNYKNEVYIKSDSSICGGSYKAELVSHPCSFDFLMSNKCWLSAIDTLDATDNPDTNGCHIHVSRTAFKDNKHYAKFKYLLQSNIELLETIGGRQLNSYCKASSDRRNIYKTNKDSVAGEKYTVCNEQHRDTIELRFMASSKNLSDVKKYIQYVDALIKYTAYHSITANYKGFYAYVKKYSSIYKEIQHALEINIDKVIGEVKYKEPKTVRVAFDKLKPIHYPNITKIYINDVFHVLSGSSVTLDFSSTTGKLSYISGHSIPNNAKLEVEYIQGY
jgi:hypothetical protein